MTAEKIRALLSEIAMPGEDGGLVAAGVVGDIELDGDEVTIVLSIDGLTLEARHALEDEVITAVQGLDGVADVLLDVQSADVKTPTPAAQGPTEPGLTTHTGSSGGQTTSPYSVKSAAGSLSGVRHLLAIASGKGGVGKSTVAVNLALALAARGARVGICDIDIYGPSVPTLLGVAQAKPGVSSDQKHFVPVEAYGLKVMSIGFLVDDETPVIWRGPIVASVVKQFLDDVEWGDLDYLVIDLPPGTGDAQLTLTQSAPLTGAIIVTTPSELSLVDAVKGLQMFRKVDTPVLGLVENMSHYICESCGHQSNPFNSGGTERISAQLGVSVLSKIPMDHDIQRGGDEGRPVVAVNPDGPQAEAFYALADAVRETCPIEVTETKKKGFLAGLFGR